MLPVPREPFLDKRPWYTEDRGQQQQDGSAPEISCEPALFPRMVQSVGMLGVGDGKASPGDGPPRLAWGSQDIDNIGPEQLLSPPVLSFGAVSHLQLSFTELTGNLSEEILVLNSDCHPLPTLSPALTLHHHSVCAVILFGLAIFLAKGLTSLWGM